MKIIKEGNFKKFICFLFGHRLGKQTDSGYPYCVRCWSHSYYESDNFNNAGLFLKPIWWLQKKWFICRLYIKLWMVNTAQDNNLPF